MLRRAVIWTLTNPRRRVALAVVVLLVLPLAVVLVVRGGAVPHGGSSQSSSDYRNGSAIAATARQARGDEELEPPAPEAEIRSVVDRFLAGYLGPTSHANLEHLRQITTRALASGLALTDPNALPFGPARAVTIQEIGAHFATCLVATPSGQLRLEIIREAGDWRISSVAREFE